MRFLSYRALVEKAAYDFAKMKIGAAQGDKKKTLPKLKDNLKYRAAMSTEDLINDLTKKISDFSIKVRSLSKNVEKLGTKTDGHQLRYLNIIL